MPLDALGLALHDQARFDEAVAAFREASALDPGYIGARLNLALSLEARGDRAEAIALVDAARERDPGNATLAFALATLLEHAKRRAEAKEWYRRVACLDPARAAELGRNAVRVVRENTGAIDRTIDMIVANIHNREVYVAPKRD